MYKNFRTKHTFVDGRKGWKATRWQNGKVLRSQVENTECLHKGWRILLGMDDKIQEWLATGCSGAVSLWQPMHMNSSAVPFSWGKSTKGWLWWAWGPSLPPPSGNSTLFPEASDQCPCSLKKPQTLNLNESMMLLACHCKPQPTQFHYNLREGYREAEDNPKQQAAMCKQSNAAMHQQTLGHLWDSAAVLHRAHSDP